MDQPTITLGDFMVYLQSPKHFWARLHGHYKTRSFIKQQAHSKFKTKAIKYVEQTVLPNFCQPDLETKVVLELNQLRATADAVIHEPETQSRYLLAFKVATSLNKRFIQQLAFQKLAAQDAYRFKRIFVILLNPRYQRGERLDVGKLFQITEVTTAVAQIEKETKHKLKTALEVAKLPTSESLLSCVQPDRCPCPELCHPALADYSIFDLTGLSVADKITLKNQGIDLLSDVPETMLSTDRQRLQKKLTIEKSDFIDAPAIRQELEKLVYPIYFLDYEAYNFPLPLYRDHWPMSQVVFQFSLHRLDQNGNLEHHSFLHLDRTDPTEPVIYALKDYLKDPGSIVVWDQSLEKSVHRHLAQFRPQHMLFLLDLNQRLFDLQNLFKQGLYVDYRFKGSLSLKRVVPVFAPELNYDYLPIAHGLEAAQRWYQLVFKPEGIEQPEIIRDQLLEYCNTDTLGCVRIFQALKQLGHDKSENN